jgi:hypothetical protein
MWKQLVTRREIEYSRSGGINCCLMFQIHPYYCAHRLVLGEVNRLILLSLGTDGRQSHQW